jgi:hypothetical protein
MEKVTQINVKCLPSLIEQVDSELMKIKRNRVKEEREMDNRRVCCWMLIDGFSCYIVNRRVDMNERMSRKASNLFECYETNETIDCSSVIFNMHRKSTRELIRLIFLVDMELFSVRAISSS